MGWELNDSPLSDTDSIVANLEYGTVPHLKLHPTLIGAWKAEVPTGYYISRFCAISAKNYSYDLMRLGGNDEIVTRVTKIRGLMLKSSALKSRLNTALMIKFIQGLAEGREMKEHIPQFRICINGQTKTLHARQLQKVYSNVSYRKTIWIY